MKQTIKQFFTKKRCKKLKVLNNKGFSLLEVLVAVSIIGIISAIAIPQFNDQREKAARVAGDTSVSNVMRAYNNCIALNPINKCNTLALLKIDCPECISGKDTNDSKFCVGLTKQIGSETFLACASIQGSTITRTYGGTLVKGKVCEKDPDGTDSKPKSAMSPLKFCDAKTDCGTDSTSATGVKYYCTQAYTKTGECGATTGECT